MLGGFGIALVKMLPPYREVIDARYRHLGRPAPGADRLLDVGCGGGDFLHRAQYLGWRAEGIDFDPKAVAAAKALGLNARIGSIDCYADMNNEFDVVTCNHVLEHVYDAHHLVRSMHRIIRPGGRLWLETPNINSAGHALFGKAWRGIESPRHIAILSYQALNSILTTAGFAITHRTKWNIQHIRGVFSASEAIRAARDPRATRTPLLPNWRLVKGLCLEALLVHRREFMCLRAIKRVDRPL
jgi:2-polyprenyl-3-methyl-5-hydroxy-6-metoxy-1,4-benzoquinol methylase